MAGSLRPGPCEHTISRLSYRATKRLIDIVISALALLISFPIMLAIAIAIKLDSAGAVIYKQKRVRGNQSPDEPHPEQRVFNFFKFRSMYANADPSAHRRYVTEYINGNTERVKDGSDKRPLYKIRNDPRITRVGRFLRRTSLDELPQFFNVLKGDMSLVGPRPALPYEVEQYKSAHRQRLVPQAGMTGLWQVSGRGRLTFEQMVQLDIEYAQRCSLLLDLQILLRTLPAIISREGAW